MLLPSPESLMGPCTVLPLLLSAHRHTLPCATFRSPHTCWCVPFFCHRVLADYGPFSIAAARPLICHGPLYRLLIAAARSRVSHGSLYGLHCCCLHRYTLCHVPLSGLLTLLVCSIFC
ncbi:unnamed protein product, partial [Staurois parvus]